MYIFSPNELLCCSSLAAPLEFHSLWPAPLSNFVISLWQLLSGALCSLSPTSALVRFYSFIYLRIFHVFLGFFFCYFFFVFFLAIFGKFYAPLSPQPACRPFFMLSSFCIFARTKLPLYCFDLSYFVCCQRWVVWVVFGWLLGGFGWFWVLCVRFETPNPH